MHLSNFEKRVLTALIEAEPEQDVLAAQLMTAVVVDREYTGVGLYTKLAIDPGCSRLANTRRSVEEIPQAHLTHPALSAGAVAMLWLSDGQLDTLECCTYAGEWPKDETQFSVSG